MRLCWSMKVAAHAPDRRGRIRWPPLFTPVMATGILSLAARGEGLVTPADALLWLGALAYLGLLGYHAARFFRRPNLLRGELRTSAIFDYLTFVAAGAVLGDGLLLAGVSARFAWALLAVSGASWLAIAATLVVELVAIRSLHPRSQLEGGWLLAVVAPQSLSILALALADRSHSGTLAALALALWLIGSALYLPIALERLWRLEAARNGIGEVRSDDWILTGALAISTLAGTHLIDSPGRGMLGPGLHQPLSVAVAVELILALASIPLLIWGESRRLRGGESAGALLAGRWSTVFPLGMLAAACGAYAITVDLGALAQLSHVLFVIAALSWLLTVAVEAATHFAAAPRSRGPR